MANFVEKTIKTQNPDWNDLDGVTDTLLDETKREMVERTVRTAIEIDSSQNSSRAIFSPVLV